MYNVTLFKRNNAPKQHPGTPDKHPQQCMQIQNYLRKLASLLYLNEKIEKKSQVNKSLSNVKYFDITFTNQMKELCDINFNSLNKDIEEDIREQKDL